MRKNNCQQINVVLLRIKKKQFYGSFEIGVAQMTESFPWESVMHCFEHLILEILMLRKN